MEQNNNILDEQLIALLKGEEFNCEEPSEGHFERFFDKVENLEQAAESAPKREIKFRRNTSTRRGFSLWKAICFPVAASVALIFIAGTLLKGLQNNKNFFAALDQNADSFAVYESYMQRVGLAYKYLSENTHFLNEEYQDEFYSLLANITEETIPLYETLPFELSEEEKTAISKSYYSDRLRAVESFEELLAQHIKN